MKAEMYALIVLFAALSVLSIFDMSPIKYFIWSALGTLVTADFVMDKLPKRNNIDEIVTLTTCEF